MLDPTTTDPTKIADQFAQQFAGIFMLITIVSLAFTVIILALWIVSLVRRWQMQKAITEMRDILREMNERDKRRMPPHNQPVILPEKELP